MQPPPLIGTLFAEAEVKNEVRSVKKLKKAGHKQQHFLITAQLPPLLRTNKNFKVLPQEC